MNHILQRGMFRKTDVFWDQVIHKSKTTHEICTTMESCADHCLLIPLLGFWNDWYLYEIAQSCCTIVDFQQTTLVGIFKWPFIVVKMYDTIDYYSILDLLGYKISSKKLINDSLLQMIQLYSFSGDVLLSSWSSQSHPKRGISCLIFLFFYFFLIDLCWNFLGGLGFCMMMSNYHLFCQI